MVQGAAADRVAHPSDRSIAWEETEGGSSLQAWSSTPRQPQISKSQIGPIPKAILQDQLPPVGGTQKIPALTAGLLPITSLAQPTLRLAQVSAGPCLSPRQLPSCSLFLTL